MPYLSPPTLTQDEQELILRATANHPRDHAIISMATSRTMAEPGSAPARWRAGIARGRRRSEMAAAEFPEMITRLPKADIPIPGVRAWVSQAVDHQVIFFDIDPIGKIPPHSHGDQWGIVVEGEMELTIGDETRRYRPGDSYHIPAGVVHSATFLSHFRAIDVFAESARYRTIGPHGESG